MLNLTQIHRSPWTRHLQVQYEASLSSAISLFPQHFAQIPPVCLYYKADGWSQPQRPSLSINHKRYSSHHLGVEKTLKSFSDLVHSTEHSNCTAIETVR